MSRFIQVVGFLAIAVFTAIGLFKIAAADPPASPDPSASSPSSAVEQRIRDALDDELPRIATRRGGVRDIVMEDVRDMIERNGSILDGSSLDPKLAAAEGRRPAGESNQAQVAEQLLKASRLLERVGSRDKDRADLVQRMRAEAVKLLSQ